MTWKLLQKAYDILFWGALIVFALCLTACLIRAILGPRTSDRIVSINMIGTITIIMLAIFSVLLDQNYLADVCIIYAMLSFYLRHCADEDLHGRSCGARAEKVREGAGRYG